VGITLYFGVFLFLVYGLKTGGWGSVICFLSFVMLLVIYPIKPKVETQTERTHRQMAQRGKVYRL